MTAAIFRLLELDYAAAPQAVALFAFIGSRFHPHPLLIGLVGLGGGLQTLNHRFIVIVIAGAIRLPRLTVSAAAARCVLVIVFLARHVGARYSLLVVRSAGVRRWRCRLGNCRFAKLHGFEHVSFAMPGRPGFLDSQLARCE